MAFVKLFPWIFASTVQTVHQRLLSATHVYYARPLVACVALGSPSSSDLVLLSKVLVVCYYRLAVFITGVVAADLTLVSH